MGIPQGITEAPITGRSSGSEAGPCTPRTQDDVRWGRLEEVNVASRAYLYDLLQDSGRGVRK